MWDYLKTTKKNILIYGRGDAAQRIVAELAKRGKEPAGFFASDGFVRPKAFLGYPVSSFSEAMERFDPKNSIVLLAFGTHREDVLQNILAIEAQTEFFAPDLPVVGEELFDKRYYTANQTRLQQAFESLADEQSRRVFRSVISYKLSGKVGFLLDCDTPSSENWALLSPSADKVYADLGAYTGDTIAEYLAACGGGSPQILAVEPEPRNFRKLTEYVKEAGLSRCRCVQAVIGDAVGTAEIAKGGGRGSRSKKTQEVPAETLDHLLDGSRADIIKMDVEGAEAAVIRGAAGTIKKYRPAMLISAYHRTEDLWSIPLQVLQIQPDYKVYLRRTRCLPAWEVNYFFIPLP